MLNILDEELCFIIIHSQRKIDAVFHKTQKKDHNFLSYGPNSHQTADV